MDGLYKRALEEGYQNYVKSGGDWLEDYNDGHGHGRGRGDEVKDPEVALS